MSDHHVTGLDLAAWLEKKAAEQATEHHTLPSGLAVELYKHISMEKLLYSGQLQLDILPAAVINGAQVEIDPAEMVRNIGDYMPMIDAIFKAAMASPRIGEETDLDNNVVAMSLFDGEVEDKLFVLNTALSGVNAMARFPGTDEPAPAGAAGAVAQHREDVRDTAVGPDGD
jgi:hypothetical protein